MLVYLVYKEMLLRSKTKDSCPVVMDNNMVSISEFLNE